jgi:hypothetical protein
VENGIAIEGEISPQLLVNIFQSKTPLHDGAVIIRANKIAAAACVLPLSDEKSNKKLRTDGPQPHKPIQYRRDFCYEILVCVQIYSVLETRPHGNNLWSEFQTFMRANSFIPSTTKLQPVSWKIRDVAVPYRPHIDSRTAGCAAPLSRTVHSSTSQALNCKFS